MAQKSPALPNPPSRAAAPHVQAAVARAAQAKLPERPASPVHPHPSRVPSAPRNPSPQAAHVRNTLAPVQAKLQESPLQGRPPAAHVQNAVGSVQRKGSMPVVRPRQAAPPMPVLPGRAVQARLSPTAPQPRWGAAVIQLLSRVVALSDVEVVKYNNPLLKATVADQAIVERAQALAASFGSALEPIETANFGAMTKDDDLYIYGHGGYSAGGQMILTAAALAARLHGNGLRAVRTIYVEGCRSGSGYAEEVANALDAKEIKYFSVTGKVTSGSTAATGARLVLTPSAQEKIDNMRFMDSLDPLGGFNGAQIAAEIKSGLSPVAEAASAVKTVRSLASFDPLEFS